MKMIEDWYPLFQSHKFSVSTTSGTDTDRKVKKVTIMLKLKETDHTKTD